MQVSIETLEGLERRMTVQIPSERVTEAVEKKLKELSKTVRIDGFRPGKVPLKVVQQKYGVPVRQEVIGDVIESGKDVITLIVPPAIAAPAKAVSPIVAKVVNRIFFMVFSLRVTIHF